MQNQLENDKKSRNQDTASRSQKWTRTRYCSPFSDRVFRSKSAVAGLAALQRGGYFPIEIQRKIDQSTFKYRSTNQSNVDQKSIQHRPNIDPKSINNRSKIDQKSIQIRWKSDFGAFWLPRAIPERFCQGLGRVLWPKRPQHGPQLGPKIVQKSIQEPSKIHPNLHLVFDRFFIDFWSIFLRFPTPKSTKNRSKIYQKKRSKTRCKLGWILDGSWIDF